MAFIESQFPPQVQYSSSGGPMWLTEVVELNGGQEQRNQVWSNARHRYNISNFKVESEIDTVIQFFNAMQGQFHGFRLKDWADYKLGGLFDVPTELDVELLLISGNDYQLVKRYIVDTEEYIRNITKPVSGTILIADGGVLQTETTNYTIDYTTGIVSMSSPSGIITGGGEYDVPVRFDTDILDIHHSSFQAITATIPMVEIRV